MKGRLLKKLKSISTPTWRPDVVFQANTPLQSFHTSNLSKHHKNFDLPTLVTPEDANENKMANADSKEKLVPSLRPKEETFHASGPNSCLHIVPSVSHSSTIAEMENPNSHSTTLPCLKTIATENSNKDNNLPLLSRFSDKCPPGGKDILVLYTTSLRGIRKTFEDCNAIRFLLESFRVVYSERDVSMHLEYREELWGILGIRVVPPKLFIRGRYIGGADEVVTLHEKGMLRDLLQEIPLRSSLNCPCRGCGGMRFLMCIGCNGSRKVLLPVGGSSGPVMRCPDCNENGLVKCSVCT